jgi:hemoglobin-like flavoprotein
MDPEQVSLIQASFAGVVPIAEDAAALFYARLFELDPALRPLFQGDLREQGRKLMTMLLVLVRGLEQPDQLLPVVEALGRRHADYGVRETQYDTVGAALLWTLRQGLGKQLTPEGEAAWTAAYTLLANVMKQAAAELSKPAPARWEPQASTIQEERG